MKKLLSFLLAVLMVLPLAISCAEEPAPEAPEEPAPPAEPVVEELEIIKDGVCYVYYDRSTIRDISVLTSALSKKLGTNVEAVAVYSGSRGSSLTAVEDNAILVGNVALPDGTHSADSLRVNDSMVGIADNRFILGGRNNEQTQKAVTYFTSVVLSAMEGTSLTFKRADNYRTNGRYSFGDISINGYSLGHYDILVGPDCSISEWRTAVLLRQFISEKIGYEPELIKGTSCPGKAVIRVGAQVCDSEPTAAHEYVIDINGTTVELVAESVFGYLKIQDLMFNELLYSTDKQGVKALDTTASKNGTGESMAGEPLEINGDVRIMYNNIHGQDEGGTMPVKQPTEMLCELYLEYLPDVIGLQECTSRSFGAGIANLLKSEYKMVYDQQTCTAMFYRTATVELLSSGYFGFDDIDEELNDSDHIYRDLVEENGYTGYDVYNNNINKDGAAGKRYDSSKGVTYGVFRLKSTGNIFLAGSTHLWWENNSDSELDEITRMIQMRALRNVLVTAADNFAAARNISGTIPIFVGGDYNASYEWHDSLVTMTDPTNSHVFTNINSISNTQLKVSTHHSYSTYDADLEIYVNLNKNSNGFLRAIDHIFINAEAAELMTVNYTGILDDDYAFLSSDHLPLYSDVTFNASAPKIN
ncbi:MAG: hypothetical protein IKM08_09380 [Clostridia bacterium]|nr:hypothetical protein [Clostridia bacterium]